MNLALYIYLCEVVGNVGFVFKFLAGITLIIVVLNIFLLFAAAGNVEDEDMTKIFKFLRITIPSFLIAFILQAVTPSQKTMYAMAAAYYGEQAVKSETFQRLNGKAMQLLEVKIDELIGEKKESK